MFKRRTKTSPLDEAIPEIYRELAGFTSDSDEYDVMTAQLERLYALKQLEKPQRVTPDTWAIIGANLFGIALIIGYERTHVITSKALSTFITRIHI